MNRGRSRSILHRVVVVSALLLAFPIFAHRGVDDLQRPTEYSENSTVTPPHNEVPPNDAAGVVTGVNDDVLKDMSKTIGSDIALRLADLPGNRCRTLSAQFQLTDAGSRTEFFSENTEKLYCDEAEDNPGQPDPSAILSNEIKNAERIDEGVAEARCFVVERDLNFMLMGRGPPGVHRRVLVMPDDELLKAILEVY